MEQCFFLITSFLWVTLSMRKTFLLVQTIDIPPHTDVKYSRQKLCRSFKQNLFIRHSSIYLLQNNKLSALLFCFFFCPACRGTPAILWAFVSLPAHNLLRFSFCLGTLQSNHLPFFLSPLYAGACKLSACVAFFLSVG